MEIKTEFSIGDKAYYMDNNVIKKLDIKAVSVSINSYEGVSKQTVSYSSDIYGNKNFVSNGRLFKDVESLLDNVKETSRY